MPGHWRCDAAFADDATGRCCTAAGSSAAAARDRATGAGSSASTASSTTATSGSTATTSATPRATSSRTRSRSPSSSRARDRARARASRSRAAPQTRPDARSATITGVFQHWDCLDPDVEPGRHLATGPARATPARSASATCACCAARRRAERGRLACRRHARRRRRAARRAHLHAIGRGPTARRSLELTDSHARGRREPRSTWTVDRRRPAALVAAGARRRSRCATSTSTRRGRRRAERRPRSAAHRRSARSRCDNWQLLGQRRAPVPEGREPRARRAWRSPRRRADELAARRRSARSTRTSTSSGCTRTSPGPSSTTRPTRPGCCSGRTSRCSGATRAACASRRRARRARTVDLLGHHPSIAIWCAHNEPLAVDIDPGGRSTPRAGACGAGRADVLPTWNKDVLDRSDRRARSSRPTAPGRSIAHSGVLPAPAAARRDRHAPLLRLVPRRRCDGLARAAARGAAPRPLRHRVRRAGGARRRRRSCDPERWPDLDWERPRPQHHALQKRMLRPARAARRLRRRSTSGATRPRRTRPRCSSCRSRTCAGCKYRPDRRLRHVLLRRRRTRRSRWSVLDHDRAPEARRTTRCATRAGPCSSMVDPRAGAVHVGDTTRARRPRRERPRDRRPVDVTARLTGAAAHTTGGRGRRRRRRVASGSARCSRRPAADVEPRVALDPDARRPRSHDRRLESRADRSATPSARFARDPPHGSSRRSPRGSEQSRVANGHATDVASRDRQLADRGATASTMTDDSSAAATRADAGHPRTGPTQRRPRSPLSSSTDRRSARSGSWPSPASCCMGFVLAHMIGNLKMYLGQAEINLYGECAARRAACRSLPRTVVLWTAAHRAHRRVRAPHPRRVRAHADRTSRARPGEVRVAARLRRRRTSRRRTMRWTGVIVGLFLIFHLVDLTWGTGQPATSCAATRTTTWSYSLQRRAGRDRLHRRQHRARRSTSSTAPGACSRASGGTTRASTSWRRYFAAGVRGRHRRRQPAASRSLVQAQRRRADVSAHEPMTDRARRPSIARRARSPTAPIEEKWDKHKFDMKLVNPAQQAQVRRSSSSAPASPAASAAATLGELGYNVKVVHVPRLAAPRALDRRAGRHQRGEELPERRRQRSTASSTTRSRAATTAPARRTCTGSPRCRSTSSTSASRRACRSPASTAACSTTARFGGAQVSAARSTPGARPASSCCSARTRRSRARSRLGNVELLHRAPRCSTSS